MPILDGLGRYGRLLRDLPGFLRHPISLEDAETILRERLRDREANFLRQVERGIFGYRHSPYLPLLKLAGCELGDIQVMVRTRGLEGTLRALREAGVYITYEEFKGRQPIVRNGRVLPVKPEDFDNPSVGRHVEAQSGGTTGPPTRIGFHLARLAAHAPHFVVAWEAYGVRGVPTAVWRGILPDASGLNNVLRSALQRQTPERWFSQIVARDLRLSRLKTEVATKAIVAMGRLCGAALPWPEAVRIADASIVARWAAETLRTQGACLILTQVSRALRVCLAARDEGVDLTGATFFVGGEPPTPAKVRAIVATGARCFPSYGFAEGGRVGTGCSRPIDGSDVHLNKDAVALLSYPRRVSGANVTVPAFLFTSLLPTASKLMLNVESDDYGVLETRACGCPFDRLGFTEHLRDIRSFSKLTGEGVTLVGSDMIAILEEVLPARFGGSPLDYQLVEEEDERGFTRLSLLASPHLDIPDEAQLIETVLEGLRTTSVGADQARAMWQEASALRVKRTPPIWTERGKLMPLHLADRSRRVTTLPS